MAGLLVALVCRPNAARIIDSRSSHDAHCVSLLQIQNLHQGCAPFHDLKDEMIDRHGRKARLRADAG